MAAKGTETAGIPLRSKVHTLQDILNMKFPPNTDFWGRKLLYPGCVTLLTGAAGSAKSMLGLNLAGALCDNKDFLGYPTRGKHRIAYLNTEIDSELLQERLKMLSTKYSYKGFYEIRACGPDYDFFSCADDVEHIKRLVKHMKATVLIIDCLYSLHTADENSEQDMKHVTKAIREIMLETGVACLLIHHTGRTGFNPRGSSVLDGWVNNIINISHNQKTGMRSLHFNKVRGTQIPEPIYLDLCCDSLELTSKVPEEDPIKKARKIPFIKTMLEEGMCEASVEDLATVCGVKEDSVVKKINMHKESGFYTICYSDKPAGNGATGRRIVGVKLTPEIDPLN